MSAHAYSEERIVEEPAIALFAALGWRTASAMTTTVRARA
jgi:type I restriction enzyme R subunit